MRYEPHPSVRRMSTAHAVRSGIQNPPSDVLLIFLHISARATL